MTRLERVINEVKNSRTGNSRPWIFDEKGNVKDSVICGEVLGLLEELKSYEINVSDKWIDNFLSNSKVKGDNTYNYNACISNNINFNYLVTDDGSEIFVIMVHLGGDIRGNYTNYFAVKFDDDYAFFELESLRQSIYIDDRYCADISLLSEGYSVYDFVNNSEVGEFYDIEKDELLKELYKEDFRKVA